jgi:hypothetical protein
MKKTILLIVSLMLISFFSPASTQAEEVCVQNYGQPVVCGQSTPDIHVLAKTGIADIDMKLVGFFFVIFSGVLYAYSVKRSSLNR